MPFMQKNMRYAHFAEICEKCGNKRIMWQSHSHVHVKLTLLTSGQSNLLAAVSAGRPRRHSLALNSTLPHLSPSCVTDCMQQSQHTSCKGLT